MTHHDLNHAVALGAAMLLSISLATGTAYAVGGESLPQPAPQTKSDKKSGGKKQSDDKKQDKKQDKKSEQLQLNESYKAARALVVDGKYQAALAAFLALGHDEIPDIANYIGYTNRKLGRYAEAKIWYEKALANDPKHTRTWQYYGMWQLEQGNRLKAEDYLQKIHSICGGDCADYKLLKEAIEENVSY